MRLMSVNKVKKNDVNNMEEKPALYILVFLSILSRGK